ncbi:MAG: MBL fold metallo-hydrolase [Armatimonadetes bacterium]|nr:MBL fold metallo-hydrolase [Armatimonadota bacterium]
MRIIPLALPTPYPVGPVNAYLLPGPPVTLVDCGPKTPEALTALRDGLERAGSCLERVGVRLEEIERLVITHGHIDHFGLAATIAGESGAEVCAHRADLPKLTGDRAFVEPMRALISEAGFPSGVAEALLDVLRRYRGQLDPITPACLLDDGTLVPLADGTLEVLHTPGHAQGHICLWNGLWDGGALISGDLLLEEISPNPLVEFDGNGQRIRTLPSLLRSLRRIAALEPAITYPGHGDPIPEPARRVRELLLHHEARKDRLGQMLAGRAWTLRELAAAWFPDLSPANLILGLSEVLGHLDLIEEAGHLAIEQRDGILHYALEPSPRAST